METIKVIILESGRECREVNPYQDMTYWKDKGFIPSKEALMSFNQWQNAESKLRTFTIEPDIELYHVPGATHRAVIIDKDKLIVRII